MNQHKHDDYFKILRSVIPIVCMVIHHWFQTIYHLILFVDPKPAVVKKILTKYSWDIFSSRVAGKSKFITL